ncbi:MAG TPA: glycosyltransferase 87 family protein [Candidatus Limnocylindria bacterium]|nr:glycosyltransferase 87 family protein [Candidatus Limnocylindria bacterium]
MRTLGAYALVATIVAVVFAAGILGGGFRAIERSDYMTYHVAARIVLDGDGACLYDVDCQAAAQRELIGEEPSFVRGALPYNSPPWLAALLVPLGLLPLHLAFGIFTVASLALLAAVTWRVAPGGGPARAIATLLLLTSWPTVMGAIRGQSTIAVVALLGLSVSGSGLALGLSAAKPTLGPIWAVWLLATRRWGELVVALAVLVALVLLAALVVAPRAVLDYPAHLLGVAAPDALGVHPEEMVNWRGAVARLGTGPWLLVIGTVATLVALAVTWAAGAGRQLAAAAAFIATPLVLPHANQHEAILAGLGVVLAIGAAGDWRTRLTVGAVATHAILWAGPVMPAEASAWMLFVAELVWLTVVAVVAVRTRSMEPARPSSQGLSQVA